MWNRLLFDELELRLSWTIPISSQGMFNIVKLKKEESAFTKFKWWTVFSKNLNYTNKIVTEGVKIIWLKKKIINDSFYMTKIVVKVVVVGII